VSAGRALHLVVNGKVQGVGFRWFTRNAARALGLNGRVRNLPDGRVEVRVAGDPEHLTMFLERMREGPPAARITEIEERELTPVPVWQGFEIDR
jgi:acylphosphatase